MTYLVSSVSRRDYLGSSNSCKSIVLPRIMREHASTARTDDAWDLSCEFEARQLLTHSLGVTRPGSSDENADRSHDNATRGDARGGDRSYIPRKRRYRRTGTLHVGYADSRYLRLLLALLSSRMSSILLRHTFASSMLSLGTYWDATKQRCDHTGRARLCSFQEASWVFLWKFACLPVKGVWSTCSPTVKWKSTSVSWSIVAGPAPVRVWQALDSCCGVFRNRIVLRQSAYSRQVEAC